MEYKTLLSEARLKLNDCQDENHRLNDALENAKEVALLESKTELNSELVTLRISAKTAKEKFEALQEQFDDNLRCSESKNRKILLQAFSRKGVTEIADRNAYIIATECQ